MDQTKRYETTIDYRNLVRQWRRMKRQRYRPGPYRRFAVYEPRRRIISIPDFEDRIHLWLNEKTRIAEAVRGVSVCGDRIVPTYMTVRRQAVTRMRRKLRKLNRKYEIGKLTREAILQSLSSRMDCAGQSSPDQITKRLSEPYDDIQADQEGKWFGSQGPSPKQKDESQGQQRRAGPDSPEQTGSAEPSRIEKERKKGRHEDTSRKWDSDQEASKPAG